MLKFYGVKGEISSYDVEKSNDLVSVKSTILPNSSELTVAIRYKLGHEDNSINCKEVTKIEVGSKSYQVELEEEEFFVNKSETRTDILVTISYKFRLIKED